MKQFITLSVFLFSQLASAALTEQQTRCLDAIVDTKTGTIHYESEVYRATYAFANMNRYYNLGYNHGQVRPVATRPAYLYLSMVTNTATLRLQIGGEGADANGYVTLTKEVTPELFLGLVNASVDNIQVEINRRARENRPQIDQQLLNTIDQVCPRD